MPYPAGMRMFRPTAFILLGGALILAGFVYDLGFAGLPYQDPTPAMQAEWLFHKRIAGRIEMTGAAILCIGLLWGAIAVIGRAIGRG